MGKVKSFFGGLIGVLLLSVIVFFIIYFFVPAVSMKFFGIAFNENSDSGSEIVALIDSLELGDDAARAEIESYLSSPAGQEAVSVIQDAASKAGESFDAFVESDDSQNAVSSAKEKGVDIVSGIVTSLMKNDGANEESTVAPTAAQGQDAVKNPV